MQLHLQNSANSYFDSNHLNHSKHNFLIIHTNYLMIVLV